MKICNPTKTMIKHQVAILYRILSLKVLISSKKDRCFQKKNLRINCLKIYQQVLENAYPTPLVFISEYSSNNECVTPSTCHTLTWHISLQATKANYNRGFSIFLSKQCFIFFLLNIYFCLGFSRQKKQLKVCVKVFLFVCLVYLAQLV